LSISTAKLFNNLKIYLSTDQQIYSCGKSDLGALGLGDRSNT